MSENPKSKQRLRKGEYVSGSQVPKFPYGTRCAVAGCNEIAVDNDHALFSAGKYSKNKRTKVWETFLENDFNKQPTCMNCNRWDRAADRYHARFCHVYKMLQDDPKGFKKWFDTYPGSRVEGSRWYEIKRMIDAYESVLT